MKLRTEILAIILGLAASTSLVWSADRPLRETTPTIQGGTGPLDTPEAGLWQREPGSQNYSFHDISYVYDENGVFAGSGVVTANIHLTSANSFEYSATIQFFDADGNLVFSGCGRGTATRFE